MANHLEAPDRECPATPPFKCRDEDDPMRRVAHGVASLLLAAVLVLVPSFAVAGSVPDVDEWLTSHPAVATQLQWYQARLGLRATPYTRWQKPLKDRLRKSFSKAWRWLDSGDSKPLRGEIFAPTNLQAGTDTAYPTTKIALSTAEEVFLRYVAISLAMEISHRLPWSVTSYTSSQLGTLFDGTKWFDRTGKVLTDEGGNVTPDAPTAVAAYMRTRDLIRSTVEDTLAAVLDDVSSFRHFTGGYNLGNMQAHWQYRGMPPISRVLSGTTRVAADGTRVHAQFTGGCWGTTGALRLMLQTLNIPVTQYVAGYTGAHSLPRFPTARLSLTHGDDPYNQLMRRLKTELSAPQRHVLFRKLLVTDARFHQLFIRTEGTAQQQDNIGIRPRELAIEYGQ